MLGARAHAISMPMLGTQLAAAVETPTHPVAIEPVCSSDLIAMVIGTIAQMRYRSMIAARGLTADGAAR